MNLPILYQCEYLIAINKPHGLLVHRSSIAAHENIFALQLLRDQIGKKIFPVHRLDRKTSGVLIFALSSEIARNIQQQIKEKLVEKRYLAIVRGFFPEKIRVDYPLTNDKNITQDALTDFKCLQQTEIDVPFGKHNTSRYSLIEVFPKTGRMHQIRKHCNHLRHPIIGDRPHGCNKQNRLFKEKWNMTTMMLHAQSFSFTPPILNKKTIIKAPTSEEFKRVQKFLGFE